MISFASCRIRCKYDALQTINKQHYLHLSEHTSKKAPRSSRLIYDVLRRFSRFKVIAYTMLVNLPFTILSDFVRFYRLYLAPSVIWDVVIQTVIQFWFNISKQTIKPTQSFTIYGWLGGQGFTRLFSRNNVDFWKSALQPTAGSKWAK